MISVPPKKLSPALLTDYAYAHETPGYAVNAQGVSRISTDGNQERL